MIYRTGCSGWSYDFWKGKIYNYSEDHSFYLKDYSRIFDTVEIDSTFYAPQGKETVKKWYDSVPENFLFSPKMPMKITHEDRLVNCKEDLNYFIKNISILDKKLGFILIQLPPDFTYNIAVLENFIELLPSTISYAMEFRHSSWFRNEVYQILKKFKITMAWPVLDYIKTPEIKTTENLYIRFLGNKSLSKKDLGEIRLNRRKEIIDYVNRIKNNQVTGNVFIYANNHYEGLSPDTIKFIRQQLGLSMPPSMVMDRQKKLF
ncbi:DUF72 domain-containing protein [Ferroplasma sp.]|uniref:DUF72 domain-containing protein n=1 Tax=Ferroplasma sp. TaxID=2591003 RepID=UPI00307E830A